MSMFLCNCIRFCIVCTCVKFGKWHLHTYITVNAYTYKCTVCVCNNRLRIRICDICTLTGLCITKTYLYNFDPLKPHFYTVKLGFTGVSFFFLFLLRNIDFWYSLEPPVLTSTHNLCFEQNYDKYQSFFIWKFSVFGGEIFYIYEQVCFRNGMRETHFITGLSLLVALFDTKHGFVQRLVPNDLFLWWDHGWSWGRVRAAPGVRIGCGWAPFVDLSSVCNSWKNGNNIFPDRGSNPVHWTQSLTLYRVAIKVGLYRRAVQVCYIPIPNDMLLELPSRFEVKPVFWVKEEKILQHVIRQNFTQIAKRLITN